VLLTARTSAGSSSNILSASKASCLEAVMRTPDKDSRSLAARAVKDSKTSLDEGEKCTQSRGHFQRSASGSSSFQRYIVYDVGKMMMIVLMGLRPSVMTALANKS